MGDSKPVMHTECTKVVRVKSNLECQIAAAGENNSWVQAVVHVRQYPAHSIIRNLTVMVSFVRNPRLRKFCTAAAEDHWTIGSIVLLYDSYPHHAFNVTRNATCTIDRMPKE